MRFFKNYSSKNESSGALEEDDETSSRCRTLSKKVFALIHKEKWDRVPKILRGKYGSEICGDTDQTGLTILGMAVGSNPPLHVVELILKINPSLSSTPDSYGALPIHLACLNGASAAVIKFLIKHDNGQTVKIADEDQRVPLHHAVEFSARLDIQENASPQEFNSNFSDSRSSLSSYSNFEEDLEIIGGLCNAAPELVRYTDKNGDTPIDVAHVIKGIARTEKQHFRIDKVYHILRAASISVYKHEKKQWEQKGYDVSFGTEVGSKQDSCETETITSWSVGSESSGHSKSMGSRSDHRFACSDQDLDLSKDFDEKVNMGHMNMAGEDDGDEYEDGDGNLYRERDTRYVDESKMKYFGFS